MRITQYLPAWPIVNAVNAIQFCRGGGRCGQQFLMRRNAGAWVVFCLSCIMFDDIQKPNIIKVETFEYNNKKQTFYRMGFYPSCKDSNNNITLMKE